MLSAQMASLAVLAGAIAQAPNGRFVGTRVGYDAALETAVQLCGKWKVDVCVLRNRPPEDVVLPPGLSIMEVTAEVIPFIVCDVKTKDHFLARDRAEGVEKFHHFLTLHYHEDFNVEFSEEELHEIELASEEFDSQVAGFGGESSGEDTTTEEGVVTEESTEEVSTS